MDILKAKYGAETIDGLNAVSKEYPSLEEVVSKQPNVYVAGWGYGLSESKNMTPETLKNRDWHVSDHRIVQAAGHR